jgi:hypothetical protein
MTSSKAPAASNVHRTSDATNFSTSIHWLMAALLLGAAGACWIWFGLTPNFDPDSRDFNPLVGVPLFLGAFGAYSVFRAVRGTLRHRRFGESFLDTESESVPLGGTLKGRIRTSVKLAPRGDYKITLRCVEQIVTSHPIEVTKERTTDHIRWEGIRRVEAGPVDSAVGIPFEFHIPETAYAMPDARAKGEVRWTVEITAPLEGIDYYALFGVLVRAKSG